MFTARYALSPYITQIRFVLKGLIFFCKKHCMHQPALHQHIFTFLIGRFSTSLSLVPATTYNENTLYIQSEHTVPPARTPVPPVRTPCTSNQNHLYLQSVHPVPLVRTTLTPVITACTCSQNTLYLQSEQPIFEVRTLCTCSQNTLYFQS